MVNKLNYKRLDCSPKSSTFLVNSLYPSSFSIRNCTVSRTIYQNRPSEGIFCSLKNDLFIGKQRFFFHFLYPIISILNVSFLYRTLSISRYLSISFSFFSSLYIFHHICLEYIHGIVFLY